MLQVPSRHSGKTRSSKYQRFGSLLKVSCYSIAVFYNVIAWRITGQDEYADVAAGFIDTWFLNNATAMNPNLEFVISRLFINAYLILRLHTAL